MVDGARDYRLMNRKYVDALLSLKEYNRFSKIIWLGILKVKWVEFEKTGWQVRQNGHSGSSFCISLDGI